MSTDDGVRAAPEPADAARRVAAVADEFAPQRTYLDTASLGLPPRRTLDAVQAALDGWRDGTLDARRFDDAVEHSREAYARLVRVDPCWVAVGAQVSSFVGLVAASLPPGSEVLTATGDFTSVLFPFLAQHDAGITVREVPLERLAEEVRTRTSLVAVSAVQSADGRCADLDALVSACEVTGTRTLAGCGSPSTCPPATPTSTTRPRCWPATCAPDPTSCGVGGPAPGRAPRCPVQGAQLTDAVWTVLHKHARAPCP